jgi:hypothetical protein
MRSSERHDVEHTQTYRLVSISKSMLLPSNIGPLAYCSLLFPTKFERGLLINELRVNANSARCLALCALASAARVCSAQPATRANTFVPDGRRAAQNVEQFVISFEDTSRVRSYVTRNGLLPLKWVKYLWTPVGLCAAGVPTCLVTGTHRCTPLATTLTIHIRPSSPRLLTPSVLAADRTLPLRHGLYCGAGMNNARQISGQPVEQVASSFLGPFIL